MAAEMALYLTQETLFWRLSGGGILTLGGYLMREHRLLALQRELLGAAEQEQLATAVSQFNTALVERIVRFEHKAHMEMEARLRQWGEYLNEAEWKNQPEHTHYATAVETREMMAVLIARLSTPPYQLAAHLSPRLGQLDAQLRGQWVSGDFVWPSAWQPAYPQARYWWLYGRPR